MKFVKTYSPIEGKRVWHGPIAKDSSLVATRIDDPILELTDADLDSIAGLTDTFSFIVSKPTPLLLLKVGGRVAVADLQYEEKDLALPLKEFVERFVMPAFASLRENVKPTSSTDAPISR